MGGRRAVGIALLLGLVLGAVSTANAACRQALAIGMDVSASVDAREYALQRHGLAHALTAPEVVNAFSGGVADPVFLMVYEWSGYQSQTIVQSWIAIHGRAELETVADRLLESADRPPENATALGGAALFAARAFAQVPQCWRKTLDLSGDGRNNDGPTPRMLAQDPRLAGVTINGLVIIPDAAAEMIYQDSDDTSLITHFETSVIKGPGAFAELALGFEDFEAAMRRKLLREIHAPMLSELYLSP